MTITAKEFIKKNADILLAPITKPAFEQLTDGCVVFIITTTPGQKDIKERAVRNAGYYLVVSKSKNHLGQTVDITAIGLTAGGYAKVECFDLNDIEYERNKMVFLCKPLPQNDMRRNYHFLR